VVCRALFLKSNYARASILKQCLLWNVSTHSCLLDKTTPSRRGSLRKENRLNDFSKSKKNASRPEARKPFFAMRIVSLSLFFFKKRNKNQTKRNPILPELPRLSLEALGMAAMAWRLAA
jgi:hypothetical protein